MTPFSMAIPYRAVNPTKADTERFNPASGKAKRPPTAANGTTSRIRNASLPESNAVTSRKKMAMSVIGTISLRRATRPLLVFERS